MEYTYLHIYRCKETDTSCFGHLDDIKNYDKKKWLSLHGIIQLATELIVHNVTDLGF